MEDVAGDLVAAAADRLRPAGPADPLAARRAAARRGGRAGRAADARGRQPRLRQRRALAPPPHRRLAGRPARRPRPLTRRPSPTPDPEGRLMTDSTAHQPDHQPGTLAVGWIGAGRMGAAMATRLARAGEDVDRLEPHPGQGRGAHRGRLPGRRHDRRPARPRRRLHDGLHPGRPRAGARRRRRPARRRPSNVPGVVVDCSTVSTESSAAMRAACAERGVDFLAAAGQRQRQGRRRRAASAWSSPAPRRPTSGSRRCSTTSARARRTSARATLARLAKICHNLMLGVVTQYAGRDHRARREGRHARARRSSSSSTTSVMGSVVHPLQVAGVRAPRLHADVHADPAAQGLRPRLRGRPRARRADAGRRRDRRSRAGQP